MKRISKAVREEAIEALLCAAGSPSAIVNDAADALGFDLPTWEVTEWRHKVASVLDLDLNDNASYDLSCLETAYLLMEGWNPGDLVVLRDAAKAVR